MSTIKRVKLKNASGEYLYPENYCMVSNMPTASEDFDGVVVIYIGEDQTDQQRQNNGVYFQRGYMYMCSMYDPRDHEGNYLPDGSYYWWVLAEPYSDDVRQAIEAGIQQYIESITETAESANQTAISASNAADNAQMSIDMHSDNTDLHIIVDPYSYLSMPPEGAILMSTGTEMGSNDHAWRWGDIVKPLTAGDYNYVEVAGNLLYVLDTTNATALTRIIFDLGAGEKQSLEQPCSFGLYIIQGTTARSVSIATTNENNTILWSESGTNPPVFSANGGYSISTASRSYMLRFYWDPQHQKLLGTCAFSVDA